MVRIELATLEDKTRLAELYEQLASRPSILDKLEEELQNVLSRPEYRLVVARDEKGKTVGTAMGVICQDLVGECKPFMVIENVVVDKAARGGGIGRSIMQDLESHASKQGCGYIIFVSGAERVEAHRFYASMGYELGRARGFKKIL